MWTKKIPATSAGTKLQNKEKPAVRELLTAGVCFLSKNDAAAKREMKSRVLSGFQACPIFEIAYFLKKMWKTNWANLKRKLRKIRTDVPSHTPPPASSPHRSRWKPFWAVGWGTCLQPLSVSVHWGNSSFHSFVVDEFLCSSEQLSASVAERSRFFNWLADGISPGTESWC